MGLPAAPGEYGALLAGGARALQNDPVSPLPSSPSASTDQASEVAHLPEIKRERRERVRERGKEGRQGERGNGGGGAGRETDRQMERDETVGRRGEKERETGKGSGKNLLAAGRRGTRAAVAAKGGVARWWHVAQEPAYVAQITAPPLGSRTDECPHLYEGMSPCRLLRAALHIRGVIARTARSRCPGSW